MQYLKQLYQLFNPSPTGGLLPGPAARRSAAVRHRRFVAVPLDHLHPLSQQHRDAGDALWPSVASSSENRTEAVLGTVLQAHGPWAKALGQAPASGRRRPQWRRRVLVVTTATGTRSPTQQPSGQTRRPPRRGSTEPAPRSLSRCLSHAGDENGWREPGQRVDRLLEL